MNWFAQHRSDWIAEMLRVYGFINRQHVMRRFGVSNAAAALDFREFNKFHPGVMQYDKDKRTYVASTKPEQQ